MMGLKPLETDEIEALQAKWPRIWNVVVTAQREADALTEEVEALRAALTFGVKLYGMDGPAYWPVDDRIRFDELARAALKGKDHE